MVNVFLWVIWLFFLWNVANFATKLFRQVLWFSLAEAAVHESKWCYMLEKWSSPSPSRCIFQDTPATEATRRPTDCRGKEQWSLYSMKRETITVRDLLQDCMIMWFVWFLSQRGKCVWVLLLNVYLNVFEIKLLLQPPVFLYFVMQPEVIFERRWEQGGKRRITDIRNDWVLL